MTVINLVHGLSYLENRTEYIYYLEYEIKVINLPS